MLYLIFTEGYASTRADLAAEAIRLTRMMHRALPRDSEVAGLLALMLLTDARREAQFCVLQRMDAETPAAAHKAATRAVVVVEGWQRNVSVADERT